MSDSEENECCDSDAAVGDCMQLRWVGREGRRGGKFNNLERGGQNSDLQFTHFTTDHHTKELQTVNNNGLF